MPVIPVVVQGSQAMPVDRPVSAVTIGNFDGVHLGHRALLRAARAHAGRLGGPVVALTFHPSPRDVMVPGHGVPAIQTLADRVQRLGEQGADVVVIEPFTRELALLDAPFFAMEIVGRRLGAGAVIIGWDFRYGRDRRGDSGVLREALGVPVQVLPPVEVDGAPVNSTRVRALVRQGEVAAAARLLGQPHEVVGMVVHGDARGRTIGFPTANVAMETELRPPTGVYAVRASASGQTWDGVANLGRRPTFAGGELRLEVHLLDVDVDVYGAELRVGFVERVRGEQTFPDTAALRAQIALDVVTARELLR